MPFDSKEFVETDSLGKTILFLSDSVNWCHVGSKQYGGQLCILHALWQFEDIPWEQPSPTYLAILAAKNELFPRRRFDYGEDGCGLDTVAQFNDHPDTTHDDVMRVLLRARELLAP